MPEAIVPDDGQGTVRACGKYGDLERRVPRRGLEDASGIAGRNPPSVAAVLGATQSLGPMVNIGFDPNVRDGGHSARSPTLPQPAATGPCGEP